MYEYGFEQCVHIYIYIRYILFFLFFSPHKRTTLHEITSTYLIYTVLVQLYGVNCAHSVSSSSSLDVITTLLPHNPKMGGQKDLLVVATRMCHVCDP